MSSSLFMVCNYYLLLYEEKGILVLPRRIKQYDTCILKHSHGIKSEKINSNVFQMSE